MPAAARRRASRPGDATAPAGSAPAPRCDPRARRSLPPPRWRVRTPSRGVISVPDVRRHGGDRARHAARWHPQSHGTSTMSSSSRNGSVPLLAQVERDDRPGVAGDRRDGHQRDPVVARQLRPVRLHARRRPCRFRAACSWHRGPPGTAGSGPPDRPRPWRDRRRTAWSVWRRPARGWCRRAAGGRGRRWDGSSSRDTRSAAVASARNRSGSKSGER